MRIAHIIPSAHDRLNRVLSKLPARDLEAQVWWEHRLRPSTTTASPPSAGYLCPIMRFAEPLKNSRFGLTQPISCRSSGNHGVDARLAFCVSEGFGGFQTASGSDFGPEQVKMIMARI